MDAHQLNGPGRVTTLRYLTIASVGLAAAMLVCAPAYTMAEDAKPSMIERLEQKADETGSKVKGRAEDAKAVTSMVEQRLKEDPQLKGAKINARVDSGIVTLTGEVKSLALSSRASEVLSDVPGVRAVRNALSYEPRSSSLAPT